MSITNIESRELSYNFSKNSSIPELSTTLDIINKLLKVNEFREARKETSLNERVKLLSDRNKVISFLAHKYRYDSDRLNLLELKTADAKIKELLKDKSIMGEESKELEIELEEAQKKIQSIFQSHMDGSWALANPSPVNPPLVVAPLSIKKENSQVLQNPSMLIEPQILKNPKGELSIVNNDKKKSSYWSNFAFYASVAAIGLLCLKLFNTYYRSPLPKSISASSPKTFDEFSKLTNAEKLIADLSALPMFWASMAENERLKLQLDALKNQSYCTIF